ncbi:MAG: TatD family hydrolase [bacterium]
MTTPLIDSHAHLDFDRFDDDREAVLERARDAGVDSILTIGTDLASSLRAVALARAWPRVFASVGVHPHEADAFDDAHWPELTALFRDPRVRAVGETGLDYYYDYSDRGRQQALFARHLELCGEVARPVVVHIRDAFEDTWRLVEAVGLPAGGVVHCFTGGPAECERALELGFHVSLSGVVTFKNAKALREAATLIPADRLLVETDAPFLAPVPHRGKRNEPAFVVHTAREVAALRGESFEALAAATRANTVRLFGLDQPGSQVP